MAFIQENRPISINTPLGENELLLSTFKGTEEISNLFVFELSMLSENHNINFENIIGKSVTVSIVLADGSRRYYNGIINTFTQGRGGGDKGEDTIFSYYSAIMVPWLWLLTRTYDSRIFQQLSTPEIIEQIFSENGFNDYKIQLHDQYEKREYCVQYRETDFNFISRLLEDEGIYYYFEHTDSKHTLIIADAPEENKPCPNQDSAIYRVKANNWIEEDVVTSLEKKEEIQPGKYTLNDYNFEIPDTDLKVETPSIRQLGPTEREIYDYPGVYDKRDIGEKYSNIRMQEQEAFITTIIGSSQCRSFTSGYRFALKDFYREDMNNKSFVLTSITHRVHQNYLPDKKGTFKLGEPVYTNYFTAIPSETPYRPKRKTPKPFIKGSQTAIVVGPPGEEIYTDKYGRVKVQFHWDREGTKDENSSCWIRVSNIWAGAGFGGINIPRVNQEVIVDFLEGNPDKPIITGRVYHGTNLPPYDLPGEKTKSTIKSNSYPEGGGYNEIRFEDKKGEEEYYTHAEKNQNEIVKNCLSTSVGFDQTVSVGNNRSISVEKDEYVNIKENRKKKVEQNEDNLIVCDRMETVEGSRHIMVKSDQFTKIDGDNSYHVGGSYKEKTDGVYSIQASNNYQKADLNHAVEAGQEIHFKAGMKIIIEAGMEITIKAGANFIKLDPTGISIVGVPMAKINSGGMAGQGSGCSPESPSPPTEASI